jgi:hypothetical protein
LNSSTIVRTCVISYLLLCPILSPSQSESNEEGRTQELIERRRQKLENPHIGRPNKVEDTLLYLEGRGRRLLFGINWKNFYPKFGGCRPGAGFGGGIRYYKYRLKDSDFTVEGSALFSMRNYQRYELQLGAFNRTDPAFFTGPADLGAPFDFMEDMRPGRAKRRSNLILFADFEHQRFPQERFWGLGPDSDSENRSNYQINSSSYSLFGGYRFNRWIAAAAGAGFLQVDLREGTDSRFPTTQELFDGASAPGLHRQPDFLRLASVLYFNYQDTPGNPHKGGVIGLFFFRYDDLNGNEFEFNRFALDARHYIPLGSKQRTLALRLLTLNDRPGKGSRVPFYLMNTLGGSQTLRGFPDFRFRDANLFTISAEYRWEPAPALEFALFYDTGKVYGSESEFDFNNLRKDYGIGIRVKSRTGTFLRLDISRSNEGTRLQFAFGPSF